MNNRRPMNCMKSLGKNAASTNRHLAVSQTLRSEIIRSRWPEDNKSNTLKELKRVALSGAAPISPHRQNCKPEVSIPSSSRCDTTRRSSTPEIHHIMWHGFDDDDIIEPIGSRCNLCEKDLSYSEIVEIYDALEEEEDDDYYYEEINEDRQFPEVSILGCGHCFHSTCLEDTIPYSEGYLNDPPCFICLSIS